MIKTSDLVEALVADARPVRRLRPPAQRAALWLTAVEGQSYAEVAAALATSETAVKALVHRGRAALAEALEGFEGAASGALEVAR